MAGILLVSTDPTLGGACRRALEALGHTVTCVPGAAEAVRAALTVEVQAVVLDSRTPDCPGFLRWLRADGERARTPLLHLVAPAAFDANLSPPVGFRPGVDAVLPRPFSTARLAEAVAALLGPPARRGATERVSAGPFLMDVRRRTLSIGERSVAVTAIESRLLAYLMQRPGVPVGVEELLTRVWGYYPGTGGPEVVRAHVRNIRRKLHDIAPGGDVLLTVPRLGYRFMVDAAGGPS